MLLGRAASDMQTCMSLFRMGMPPSSQASAGSAQSVGRDGGTVEHARNLGGGQAIDELLGRRPGLAVATGQRGDGPVAAVQHAGRTERVDDVVDEGLQVVRVSAPGGA